MADSSLPQICACCFMVLYFIALIIFCVSFQTLQPNQAGLLMNSITGVLDKSKVYTGGRYLVGPGQKFLVFPLYAQNIDLASTPLLVTSSSKQSFTISVTIQYRLLNTASGGEIVQIYNSYNNNLQGLTNQLTSLATSAIKNTCTTFPTENFFGAIPGSNTKILNSTYRKAINAQITTAIQNAFAQAYCDVIDVQVQAIGFGSCGVGCQNFVNQVNQKVVSLQAALTADVIQQNYTLALQQNSYATQAAAVQTVLNSQANGYGRELLANYTAQGFVVNTQTRTNMYNIIQSKLGFTKQQLIQYIYLKTVEAKASASTLMAGFMETSGVLRDNIAASK